MCCLLWESSFYESGQSIADRINTLVEEMVKSGKADKVAEIAVEARIQMHLRHVPLHLCVSLARQHALKAATLAEVIQRPDELSEFLSMYSLGREGRKTLNKLSYQARKGLGMAFQKFNEYSLQKYNGGQSKVKLRDVLFLCHAKPKDAEQDAMWKRLVEDKLATPDTWEVEISQSKDKTTSWTRLLSEKKLGAMALLRNLRNMTQAGVSDALVREALATCKSDRVLPFRFIAAARAVPQLEDALEPLMMRCLARLDKLPGRTMVIVDNSGSMGGKISEKSEMSRSDAACALAILLREICGQCAILSFSDDAKAVPPRQGFALADAIRSATPMGGTNTDHALAIAGAAGYDRVVLITDEQTHPPMSATQHLGWYMPTSSRGIRGPLPNTKAYGINVSCEQHGITYGQWVHIDGWSEAVVRYIAAVENIGMAVSEDD